MKISTTARLFSCLLLPLTLAAGTLSVSAAETPQVGAAAPDFSLKTMDAKPVTLSGETARLPVVLVVLRGWPGYQCPLCTRQVHEFVAQAGAFSGKARVIMVYPGPADDLKKHATEFLQEKNWPADFQFVLDPDYTMTKAYGLRWEGKNETAYPATFIIDTNEKVLFAHVSKEHGDRDRKSVV